MYLMIKLFFKKEILFLSNIFIKHSGQEVFFGFKRYEKLQRTFFMQGVLKFYVQTWTGGKNM